MKYKKGHQAWNKGLPPWNKGLTMKTDIRIKPMTNEHKLIISNANKGKIVSQHTRNLIRKNLNVRKENNPNWKGGTAAFFHREARKVMLSHLNRNLNSGEVVHHLDHNRENNSLDNLHLFPSHSSHRKYHLFLRRIVRGNLK